MFRYNQQDAPLFGASDLISQPHGFSTRHGGVSTLPHVASLNFTDSTGDSPENIVENYRIFLSALGLDPAGRISSHQIHSARVRYVTEADAGRVFDDCDGFVTDRPGISLVVKTADCVPILLCDEAAGVIAAIHAGWRGTVQNIVGAAVAEMVAHGASPQRAVAVIGPCIHDCCFRVQDDFVEAVAAARGAGFAAAHIHRVAAGIYADLVGMNLALLLEAGLAPDRIDVAPHCTCCDPARYHSHRATHGLRGVMAAAIGLLS